MLNECYELNLEEDVAWLMICYLRAKYVQMYNFLFLWWHWASRSSLVG